MNRFVENDSKKSAEGRKTRDISLSDDQTPYFGFDLQSGLRNIPVDETGRFFLLASTTVTTWKTAPRVYMSAITVCKFFRKRQKKFKCFTFVYISGNLQEHYKLPNLWRANLRLRWLRKLWWMGRLGLRPNLF